MPDYSQGIPVVDGAFQLHSLKQLESAQRWLLYPAASGASYFSSFLNKKRPDLAKRVIALSDIDKDKWGLLHEGNKVVPPSEIMEQMPDLIITCSPSRSLELRQYLTDTIGVTVPVVLADSIVEYIDWEAERSVLAQESKELKVDDLDLAEWSTFFHAMPFSQNVYSRSMKGAFTYRLLEQVQIPDRLDGKTVLDLGAADGFYSLECMARGAAQATAVESFYWEKSDGLKKFDACKKHFQHEVSRKIYDVNEVSIDDLGQHDIVLCLGLYYHLRDPFRFFRNIRSVTREKLILSGRTCTTPLVNPEFNDNTNASFCVMTDTSFGKWMPNLQCLKDMLQVAGFTKIDVVYDFCPDGSSISSTAIHAS